MTQYLQRLVRPVPPRALAGMQSRPAVQEIETTVETFNARSAFAATADGSPPVVPAPSLRPEGGQAQATDEAGAALTLEHLARWIAEPAGRDAPPTGAAADLPADSSAPADHTSSRRTPLRAVAATSAIEPGTKAVPSSTIPAASGDPRTRSITGAQAPAIAQSQDLGPVAPVSPARPGQAPHREWPDRAPVRPTPPAPSRRDTGRGVVEVRVGTIELTVRNPGATPAHVPAAPVAPAAAAAPARAAAPEPLRFSASRHHLRWS